jgi:LAO/AO transport system kinase
MMTPAHADWRPPVLPCSARTGAGLDAVWEAVARHRATLSADGSLARRRADQQVEWMWAMVRDRMMDRLTSDPAVREALPGLERDVRAGGLTPTLAAERLLGALGLE